MKRLLKYLLIVPVGTILLSCDKPAPTELVDDSQEEFAEYEVLGRDINDEFYSNGFDTTGVTQDLQELPNLISLSGVKVTDILGQTDSFSFAQSIFFDRTKPLFNSEGRLLAYHTIIPGVVRFDNRIARVVPFHIRYRDKGVLRDTTLGNKYILFSGRNGNMDDFHYRHHSLMNFRINIFAGDQVSFDIPTPVEITGNVEILGSRSGGDLRALLHWSKGDTRDITIIIGARVRNRDMIMPLYRIGTRDDGELLIPTRFIKEIPLQNFDRVVFTFIRRFEGTHQDDSGNDLRVSSQSIHSIVVNLN